MSLRRRIPNPVRRRLPCPGDNGHIAAGVPGHRPSIRARACSRGIRHPGNVTLSARTSSRRPPGEPQRRPVLPRRNVMAVSEARQEGARTVLVIGDGDLSDEVATALESAGADVERLSSPTRTRSARRSRARSVDSVAVVARDDAIVLRMALIVRSVIEEVPLVLTIFDETMAEQVAGELPNTHVTSLADIVAPSLAGPCIDERATAVSVDGDEPGPADRERRRARGGARSAAQGPPDRGARARAVHARTTRAPACCSTALSASSRSS